MKLLWTEHGQLICALCGGKVYRYKLGRRRWIKCKQCGRVCLYPKRQKSLQLIAIGHTRGGNGEPK